MIHELKCKKEYFEQVASGCKPFEVRLNDRNFQVGDFVALNEVAATAKNIDITHVDNNPLSIIVKKKNAPPSYTGRSMLLLITYILDSAGYCKDGYVTLGLLGCQIKLGTVESYPYIITPVNIYETEEIKKNLICTRKGK